MLHITNGDCAVAILSRAVSGTFLPWRDVLHDGPVRAGLSLEALSAERARFIEEAGWSSDVLKTFQERDRIFGHAGTHDEIVLWFEHDLYDQLQLIQVLDGLAELRGPPVSLVCEAEYLGEMTKERAAELFALRNPLTRRHFQEARAAWAAFRSADPRGLQDLKITAFPFLGAALRRHLEEFPWTTDGLSRLERSIVGALPASFGDLFVRIEEDPKFLGDVVLKWHLERLREEGLVRRESEQWTATGGKRQRRLPRWLGGYEVRDEALRWDPALGRLVAG